MPRTAVRATLLCCALVLVSCRPDDGDTHGQVDLRGAGATFPYPVYRAWFAEYGAKAGVRINYFSVGSAEGMRLLERGDADFGAVDGPASPVPTGGGTCSRLAIPTVRGPIAIAYNVPNIPSDRALRFDGGVLARIYSGAITSWDDPALVAMNGGLTLPHVPIVVVHRAPGSGTSHAFATFLRSRGGWRSDSTSKDVVWPVGVSAEGNEGVAAEVKVTQGAIGYVELTYARQNRLPFGAVRDSAGGFVLPSGDAPNYPLNTVTWLVIDPARLSPERAEPLVKFIAWALHDGASVAHDYEYSPVHPDTVARYEKLIERIDFKACHR